MNTPSAVVSRQCNCKRTKEHLHYSSNHDFFVKCGLAFLLLAEGVAFVQGAVIGSTTILLPYDEIQRYNIVTSKTAELTGPYSFVNVVAIAQELILLLFGIVAVAMLHSAKERRTHIGAIAGVLGLFITGFVTKTYYVMASDAALARLPSMVSAETLETARRIDEEFRREYGFWGTAAPDVLNIVLSLAGVGLFVAALITSQHYTVWRPTQTAQAIALPHPEPPIVEATAMQRSDRENFCESCGSRMPAQTASCPICGHRNIAAPSVPEPTPTKFCRYCGAKIPRVSKFCEECGSRLA